MIGSVWEKQVSNGFFMIMIVRLAATTFNDDGDRVCDVLILSDDEYPDSIGVVVSSDTYHLKASRYKRLV